MDAVGKIADAVLYEGYILWPYRRSALKNRRRFTFGGVYPRAHSELHPDDRWVMRTECLVEGDAPEVEVRVRFLHVVERQVLDARGAPVDELTVDGERHLSWQEAVERELGRGAFSLPAGRGEERLRDAGAIVRSWEPLQGAVEVSEEDLAPGLRRVRVEISNTTSFAGTREDALRRTLCSTHTVLRVTGGAFVSLTDPPTALAEAAAACRNDGTWPVLVGEPGARDTILSSPIILEDHPRVAPESPGDLFDGGEIDQLLTLSILALTEEEKAEMRAADPRAREILERTEALTRDEIARLGGRWEELERPAPDAVTVAGAQVRRGSRLRLRPRPGGDVFDIALAGRAAIVEAVEQDTDGKIQLAVIVEDDPGRDLGERRQPGHRFFFAPEEVEPLAPEEPGADPGRRILIAGIGNVFLGDDGFGVALAGRLARQELPRGVDVVDFGIRGLDLAYAMDGYDAVVLLDAVLRGEPPGTIYVIAADDDDDSEVPVDAHGMDPVKVLALARALGGAPPRAFVVGCEPQTRMTGEDDEIVADLSEPVRAALDEAVPVVWALLDDLTSLQEEEQAC